ncbi:MAG: 30S ribosomal protein S4 [Patescibacteria group bacterium]
MPRTLTTSCKPCRRAGVSLCGRKKCAALKRSFPPGAHGPTRRIRLTPYGIQLREKQMAKQIYGVKERQFFNYFKKASRTRGNTAEMLVRMLEMRLDNAVFRLGFCVNRFQARQMVSHGHFDVNGKRVDVPSAQIRTGDVISVRAKMHSSPFFVAAAEQLKNTQLPSWLSLDAGALSGKVVAEPAGEELRQPFDPKIIVEFYSR